jgi:hypothetical protein
MEQIGKPLPNDSEKMPESLRAHFVALSQVSYKKNVELAMQNKA